VTVACLQSLAHEREVDVAINKPKQVVLWNMVFDPEVIKKSLFPCSVPVKYFRDASFGAS
jgi:hypothetical protein